MANITAKDVAELRKQTGVGMMDCKKALVEADGDFEKATVILREKGLATQAKKSGRVAAEGIVMAATNDAHTVGAVEEVNIETDFAANNDDFKKFVTDVAQTIIEKNPADIDALNAEQISGGNVTVAEALQELFLKIRENMHIRRFKRMEGILVPYVHGGGKIGVLVNMETPAGASDAVMACGKDCALQVAALKAPYLKKEDVPAEVIESEKSIMLVQMNDDPKMANKPENVKAKIVEGKIGKYYSENCLLDQEFVKDGDLTVQKYIDKCAKEANTTIKLLHYVYFDSGEGVEKKEDNSADAVASMMNK